MSATQGTTKIPASILWLGETPEEMLNNGRLPILEKFREEWHDDEPTFRRPLQAVANRDIVVLVDNCKDGEPDLEPRRRFIEKAWTTYWHPIGMLFVLTLEKFRDDYHRMLEGALESVLDRVPVVPSEPLVVSDPQKIVDWARGKFPEKQEDQT